MGFHYCRWWSANKCSQLAGNCESLSVWVKAALGLLGAGVLVMIIVLPIAYPCRLDSCANNGRCKGKHFRPTCECINGYTGDVCEMPPAAHLKLKYGDTCGKFLGADRSVGKESRDIKEHGYQVYFSLDGGPNRCGASIIGKTWAITAAHCLNGIDPPYKHCNIVAGLSDVSNKQETNIYDVKEVRQHKSYKNITNPTDPEASPVPIHDIGLIQVFEEIQYSASVYPICLPSVKMCLKTDTMLTITGWGAIETDHGKQYSDKLMGLEVPVFPWQACTKLPVPAALPSNTCAGGVKGKDSCKGDSGGPLAFKDRNGVWTLYGIVSYGTEPCAQRGQPGVYARVTSYIAWIKHETGIHMVDETNSDFSTDTASPCKESDKESVTPF